jgi:nitroimidazol reductase NimA-like FMN-containing flavoprotein (pyridoxamine 5'-phosphate oxidase superfamily)
MTPAIVPTAPPPGDAQTGAAAPAAREPLSRASCLELLAPGGHGRVAATMRAIPVIIAVRFALVGDEVVFNAGRGEGVARAIGGSVVAFEADQVGPDGRALWEVHVTGVARTVKGGASPDFRLSSEIVTGWRSGG